MQEFLMNLFTAVVTAAVPVVAAYVIVLIRKAGDNAAAETEDIKAQGYIKEITDAIADAVAATSQTYVDALKNAGGVHAGSAERGIAEIPRGLHCLHQPGGAGVH